MCTAITANNAATVAQGSADGNTSNIVFATPSPPSDSETDDEGEDTADAVSCGEDSDIEPDDEERNETNEGTKASESI